MQSMRKAVDDNSQGLHKIESAIRGLQRRISLETDSLVRRIETLECDKESHASQDRCDTLQWQTQNGWCKDAIGRFEALEANVQELQDCLTSNSNILSHASSLALARELLPQGGGHAFCLDAPAPCSDNDSTHFKVLERLEEKLDEIQAATCGGDGAEPLVATARSDSTIACDGNSRMATAAGPETVKVIVNQDCSFSSSQPGFALGDEDGGQMAKHLVSCPRPTSMCLRSGQWRLRF